MTKLFKHSLIIGTIWTVCFVPLASLANDSIKADNRQAAREARRADIAAMSNEDKQAMKEQRGQRRERGSGRKNSGKQDKRNQRRQAGNRPQQ